MHSVWEACNACWLTKSPRQQSLESSQPHQRMSLASVPRLLTETLPALY